jgi:AcrR family transcriptional regulator
MEKEVENTQQKILNVSTEMFVERGYQSVSMREIAEACGLSKPGLYYYFTNKQDLFLAILDSQLEVLSQLIASIQAQAETAREKIRTFIVSVLTESTHQSALIRLGTHEMTNLDDGIRKEFYQRYQDKFLSPLAGMIRTGIDSGEIRSIEPDQGVWALLGLVFPYLNRIGPSKDQVQATAAFIESVFFDGLAAK